MPTTVVTPIGTGQSGGLGAGAATPQAWANLLNGLNLVVADQIQQGQLLNQEFTAAGSVLDFSSVVCTTDSTRYIALTTATGASFRDNAGVRTNPLYYDATKGAAMRNTGASGYTININNGGGYFYLSNIQLAANSGSSGVFNGLCVTPNALTIDNCIFSGKEAVLGDNSGAATYTNCVFINPIIQFNRVVVWASSAALTCRDCTFVAVAGQNPSAIVDYSSVTTSATFTDCAFFGSTTTIEGRAGSATITYDHCASDITSGIPSGVTGNLVFGSQFNSTTNDFSVKTGAGLINAGTPVGGITTDISGFTRNVSTPTIGAWEFDAGGGGGGGAGGLLLFGGSVGWTPALRSLPLLGAAAWKAGEAIRRNATLSRRRLFSGKI